MVAVAKAYKDRSLQGFQDALALHKEQLVDDPIVHAHLSELYDTLLEGNLARLIEPFSCVEISHLAQLIKLPQDLVLSKLSQVTHLHRPASLNWHPFRMCQWMIRTWRMRCSWGSIGLALVQTAALVHKLTVWSSELACQSRMERLTQQTDVGGPQAGT